MIRKQELVNDSIYHIFNKSIAGFIIFNSKFEYERFINQRQMLGNLRKQGVHIRPSVLLTEAGQEELLKAAAEPEVPKRIKEEIVNVTTETQQESSAPVEKKVKTTRKKAPKKEKTAI